MSWLLWIGGLLPLAALLEWARRWWKRRPRYGFAPEVNYRINRKVRTGLLRQAPFPPAARWRGEERGFQGFHIQGPVTKSVRSRFDLAAAEQRVRSAGAQAVPA